MSSGGRSITPQRHEATQIGYRVKARPINTLIAMVNGLHEICTGSPPPGSQSEIHMPHDHVYTGATLPRMASFVYDAGDNLFWQIVSGSTTQWYRNDNNGTAVLSENTSGQVQGNDPPNGWFYVTPRITTADNTAVGSAACALNARIYVDTTEDCTLQIYNQNTGSGSTEIAVSASALTRITFDDIPCKGGENNRFFLQVKADTQPSTATIHFLSIGEDRNISQPASGGAATFAAATKP